MRLLCCHVDEANAHGDEFKDDGDAAWQTICAVVVYLISVDGGVHNAEVCGLSADDIISDHFCCQGHHLQEVRVVKRSETCALVLLVVEATLR